MSAEAIAIHTLSRPKVHRLPALPPRLPEKSFTSFIRQNMARRPFLFTCSAAVATVILVVLMNGFVSMLAYHINALPNNKAQVAMKNAPSVTTSSSFNDAMAAPAPSDKHSETIVLTGDSGTIVGQMAKIPPQSEQSAEINSMSAVDKNAGRELLSIVNKY